jgi:hypothetical protein
MQVTSVELLSRPIPAELSGACSSRQAKVEQEPTGIQFRHRLRLRLDGADPPATLEVHPVTCHTGPKRRRTWTQSLNVGYLIEEGPDTGGYQPYLVDIGECLPSVPYVTNLPHRTWRSISRAVAGTLDPCLGPQAPSSGRRPLSSDSDLRPSMVREYSSKTLACYRHRLVHYQRWCRTRGYQAGADAITTSKLIEYVQDQNHPLGRPDRPRHRRVPEVPTRDDPPNGQRARLLGRTEHR